MEKEAIQNNNNGNHHYNNNNQHRHNRERHGLGIGIASTNGNTVAGLSNNNSNNRSNPESGSSDFVLQWGNRKRLRCMKFQAAKDDSAPVQKNTVRIDRRVVRSADKDKYSSVLTKNNNNTNGGFNLRRRPISPPLPPVPQPQRVLRYIPSS